MSFVRQNVWSLIRISLGWVFLWSFFDKVFGLGFATTTDRAWINGGSPTFGFLNFATKGPFAGFYQGIAGNTVVDWLFMLGLLGVGAGLILGVFIKFSASVGALMLFFMYTAGFLPPENNPFMDEHIVYILVLLAIALSPEAKKLSLQKHFPF